MSINNPTKAYERNRNRNRSNHRGILKDENTQKNKSKTTTQVENQGNKKPRKKHKRHISHPTVMSYPIAVTPDEASGTRLLIKCFEGMFLFSILASSIYIFNDINN